MILNYFPLLRREGVLHCFGCIHQDVGWHQRLPLGPIMARVCILLLPEPSRPTNAFTPSLQAITTASPRSVERPRRFLISSFDSIRMPRVVTLNRGAVRSARSAASSGSITGEPNSWLGSSASRKRQWASARLLAKPSELSLVRPQPAVAALNWCDSMPFSFRHSTPPPP